MCIRDRNEWDNGLALGLVGICAAVVQGGLVSPIIRRIGERNAIKVGISIATLAFFSYGLAKQGWVVLATIVVGSLGGITGPAIQSLVAAEVDSSEQGKIQGALTSLVSLTNIIAPLFFTVGLFSYFTSSAAPVQLPGAPFLAGAVLHILAFVVAFVVFRRFPESPAERSG